MTDREQARQEAARRERDRLQGPWAFVSGRRQAELAVHGDRFLMRFSNGDVFRGVFDLDPNARPKAMDLQIEEGPEPYKGKLALAIYELDGEHLIWSTADPGTSERPWAFPPENDPNRLCLVFRRENSH